MTGVQTCALPIYHNESKQGRGDEDEAEEYQRRRVALENDFGSHEGPRKDHSDQPRCGHRMRPHPRDDYLVIADAHRRPLHSAEHILGDKLADLTALDPDDQAAMLKVLNALVMKHKLQALTGGAS